MLPGAGEADDVNHQVDGPQEHPQEHPLVGAAVRAAELLLQVL